MKQTGNKGQALVEFGLVVVMLVLLLAGTVDFGWMFGGIHTLNNAVREGARVASITIDTPAGTRLAKVTTRVTEIAASFCGAPTVGVTAATTASGEPIVTVTATCPVTFPINGKVVNLTSSSSFRDETKAGS